MAVEGIWDVGACSNVRPTWPVALRSQQAGDQWYRRLARLVGVVVVGARRLGLRAAAEGVLLLGRTPAAGWIECWRERAQEWSAWVV
jgi:hypothetical protein